MKPSMMMMGLCWGIPSTGARPYGHAPKEAIVLLLHIVFGPHLFRVFSDNIMAPCLLTVISPSPSPYVAQTSPLASLQMSPRMSIPHPRLCITPSAVSLRRICREDNIITMITITVCVETVQGVCRVTGSSVYIKSLF